jgi:hypothetical protein
LFENEKQRAVPGRGQWAHFGFLARTSGIREIPPKKIIEYSGNKPAVGSFSPRWNIMKPFLMFV